MALFGSDSRDACTRGLQSQAVIRLSVCVSDLLALSTSFDFVNHIQNGFHRNKAYGKSIDGIQNNIILTYK